MKHYLRAKKAHYGGKVFTESMEAAIKHLSDAVGERLLLSDFKVEEDSEYITWTLKLTS